MKGEEKMNERFPILSLISIILRIIGWIGVLGGLYYFGYEGIIEPNLEGHSFDGKDSMQIIQGLLGIFGGIIAVAFGELIKVLFAIEENTRIAN